MGYVLNLNAENRRLCAWAVNQFGTIFNKGNKHILP